MVPASTTRGAIDEFSAWVRQRFGPRLTRLVLFGSHARGQGTESSDVDLLVVIENLTAPEARDVDGAVGDLLTRTDVLLSPLLLSAQRFEELRARERRIVAEIERDGIPV